MDTTTKQQLDGAQDFLTELAPGVHLNVEEDIEHSTLTVFLTTRLTGMHQFSNEEVALSDGRVIADAVPSLMVALQLEGSKALGLDVFEQIRLEAQLRKILDMAKTSTRGALLSDLEDMLAAVESKRTLPF